MPLLRYRTRDITSLRRVECACGRTLVVMDKILGRSDDMLIISGVNVFPSQIEALLMDIEEMEPHYRIRVTKRGHLDAMKVEAEAKPEIYTQGPQAVAELGQRLAEHIKEIIGVSAPVEVVPSGSIARSEGKAKRVFDER